MKTQCLLLTGLEAGALLQLHLVWARTCCIIPSRCFPVLLHTRFGAKGLGWIAAVLRSTSRKRCIYLRRVAKHCGTGGNYPKSHSAVSATGTKFGFQSDPTKHLTASQTDHASGNAPDTIGHIWL